MLVLSSRASALHESVEGRASDLLLSSVMLAVGSGRGSTASLSNNGRMYIPSFRPEKTIQYVGSGKHPSTHRDRAEADWERVREPDPRAIEAVLSMIPELGLQLERGPRFHLFLLNSSLTAAYPMNSFVGAIS